MLLLLLATLSTVAGGTFSAPPIHRVLLRTGAVEWCGPSCLIASYSSCACRRVLATHRSKQNRLEAPSAGRISRVLDEVEGDRAHVPVAHVSDLWGPLAMQRLYVISFGPWGSACGDIRDMHGKKGTANRRRGGGGDGFPFQNTATTADMTGVTLVVQVWL